MRRILLAFLVVATLTMFLGEIDDNVASCCTVKCCDNCHGGALLTGNNEGNLVVPVFLARETAAVYKIKFWNPIEHPPKHIS